MPTASRRPERSTAAAEEQVSRWARRAPAHRHLQGATLRPPARCRDGRPGVARSHECREGATGSCRTDSETRKFRKQVSACCAAQTRNARIAGRTGRRSWRHVRLVRDVEPLRGRIVRKQTRLVLPGVRATNCEVEIVQARSCPRQPPPGPSCRTARGAGIRRYAYPAAGRPGECLSGSARRAGLLVVLAPWRWLSTRGLT
jgi:hypothetical protein